MPSHSDYEQLLQTFYERILRPGDVAIDIGAHSGRHTISMAKAVTGKDCCGLVYAFEPIPTVQEWLLHRLRVDGVQAGVVKLQPYALADYDGTAEFVIAVDRPEESGLRERLFNGPTSVEKINVEVRRLDSLEIEGGGLTFIKIDCEGAEHAILQGGQRTIVAHRPVVAFEFGKGSYSVYGITSNDVYDYFESINYLLSDILGQRLDRQRFGASCDEGLVWDYVAVPMERREILKNLGASHPET